MIDRQSSIYVAGHQGMVGTHIVQTLMTRGYKNLIVKTRKELNLFDQKAVRTFFKRNKPVYVILAAARVGGIKANRSYPADFLYENLLIQNNVMWAAHEVHVKKLLFLGSSCIYPRECPQPMKEKYFMTGTVEPTNEGYAIAKIAGMKLCQKIYKQYGQCFISCMPTNIYGPHDHFNNDASHVIPALIARMHEGKMKNSPTVSIWGTGMSRREFLYVEDLADAVLWLMNHYDHAGFLNVGTGQDISINELAMMIQEIVQYKGKITFDDTKPDGMPIKLLDTTKMNSLGWRYSTSLADGLKKTYQFYFMHVADKKKK